MEATITVLSTKHNIIKKRYSSFLGQSSFQPKFLKLVASYNSVAPLSSTKSSSLTPTAIKPAGHDLEIDGSVTLEIQPELDELKKIVHVKFVLEKACSFGEQMMLVGDDPMLGAWDPKNALPLQWSDGHLWTAELEAAVGKSIQYKYLLKGISGEVLWQCGADRIVRIWDTCKTIAVSENWDDASSLVLTEEEEEEEVITEEAKSSAKVRIEDEEKNLESSEKNKKVGTEEQEGWASKAKSGTVFQHVVIGSNIEPLFSNDVSAI